MQKIFLKYIKIMTLLVLVSCSNEQDTVKFIVGTKKGTKYLLMKDIIELLNKHNIKSEIILIEERKGNGVKEALLSKKADFGILENDYSTDSPKDLYSVMPLYPSIAMILYKSDTLIRDINQLIRGNKISFYLKENEKTSYALNLLKEYGINENDYTPIFNTTDNNLINDSTKVCFYLTGYDNTKVFQMVQEGSKIFGFDDINLAFRGSSVDAFCIKHIFSYPFIIPKNLFRNYPNEPLLTIAVDAVLVSRPDLDDELVQKVTRLIFEQKGSLGQKNNVFGFVTEKFNQEKLKFPLHQGAKSYFERNEPTFLEKYIEIIGFIFSIIFALFGGIKSFILWNKVRKKNRIDEYYKAILDTQEKLINFTSLIDINEQIDQLILLRKKAFDELMSEKLTANESFKIFMELLDTTINDLRMKKNQEQL